MDEIKTPAQARQFLLNATNGVNGKSNIAVNVDIVRLACQSEPVETDKSKTAKKKTT